MKRKFWFIIAVLLIMLSCKDNDPIFLPLGFTFDVTVARFVFVDSTGSDYFLSNRIKPGSLRIEEAIYQYEQENGFYVFNVDFGNTQMPGSTIVRHEVYIDTSRIGLFEVYDYDRVGLYNKKEIEMPGWLIELSKENLGEYYPDNTYYLDIYELFYNGKLLTPPQVDKNGDWVTHRIVVKEDF